MKAEPTNAPWLDGAQQALAHQILESHQRGFGCALIAGSSPKLSRRLTAQELFNCGFPVLAHGGGSDPKLSYANAAALQLWETTWADLIGLPSRLTAPESERSERRHALGEAQALHAVTGYAGIRISRKGRRFQINNARIWTLWDAQQQPCGQAASFGSWWWL